MWLILTLSFLTASPTSNIAPPFVSDNFEIQSAGAFSTEQAIELSATAQFCERWRERLQAQWSPQTDQPRWTPRCLIVLHPTKESYLQAVGRGGAATKGSSLIDFQRGKVSRRQIDLFVDKSPSKASLANSLSALPHELTHVILADLFNGRQPPRWIDEGIAVLADQASKQQLHQRDLKLAFDNQATFSAGELLLSENYPQAKRMGTFYGQSASMVAFLAQREDPAKLILFTRRVLEQGYDVALREIYQIDGISAFERLWNVDQSQAIAFHDFQVALVESAPIMPVSR